MQNKNSAQKNILIIEDEKPTRRILKDKLKSNKFNILEAENGEEGLEISLKMDSGVYLLVQIVTLTECYLGRITQQNGNKK